MENPIKRSLYEKAAKAIITYGEGYYIQEFVVDGCVLEVTWETIFDTITEQRPGLGAGEVVVTRSETHINEAIFCTPDEGREDVAAELNAYIQ